MNHHALDFLVCPLDLTPLELIVWEETRSKLTPEEEKRAARQGMHPDRLSRVITTGVLVNRDRGVYYPIHAGVPRMLTFTSTVGEHFAALHATRLARELPGLSLPTAAPQPGESDVLRSFSVEWTSYDWDGRSYWNVTPEVMFEALDFSLDTKEHPLNGRRVLEVGIGIGAMADHLCRDQDCDMVGVDLSHAVDVAQRHFGANPFFHIVQASAFAPPFRHETFDLVYSQGVLHHTYSTREAFNRISRLPKKDGRLYIWVYSHYDESRTLERRVLMLAERTVRPLLWRLPTKLQTAALIPAAPLYMASQYLRKDAQAGGISYTWREAMHAARDRFTPRYVHRHSEAEVSSWFAEAGYSEIKPLSARSRPERVPLFFSTCTGIEGVRRS